ncbi:hypothetical protein AAMO2058_001040400 [Amorphochlora amoebiformis]
MESDYSCINAVIRIRPLLKFEKDRGAKPVVQSSVKTVGIEGKSFTYDAVFKANSSQKDIYNRVSPVVKSFLQGYNGTIIAYGQTGSGKTYTMGTSASSQDNGVIPQACEEIFKTLSQMAETKNCEIQATFVEIYNETIQDLLKKASPIDHMKMARKKTVRSPQEVMRCLEEGSHSRATGSTKMNKESSRSHAIFTLWLTQVPKDNDEKTEEESDEVLASKFHFVDLAGSERIKKTGAEGHRRKEGIQINKGLFALSQVITALSEKKSHVPFRDSKITRLLEDSLGGNAKTVLIACISPADDNKEESLQTLRYASQVEFKNKPELNFSINDAKIKRYRLRIGELEKELDLKAAQREIKVYKELWVSTPTSSSPNISPQISPRNSLSGKDKATDLGLSGVAEHGSVKASSAVSKLSGNSEEKEEVVPMKEENFAKPSVKLNSGKDMESLATEMAKDDDRHTQYLNRSRRQMVHLTNLLMQKETEIQKLTEELKSVGSQKEEVENMLTKYQNQLVNKEKEMRVLSKTGKNPRQERKMKELSSQIKTLKKKLKSEEAKRNNLSRTESRLKRLQTDMLKAKQEKVRLQKDMEKREKTYREKCAQKERRLRRLMKERRKVELEKNRLKNKLAKQNSVAKQKETQIKILKNKVQRMQPKPSTKSYRKRSQTIGRERSRKRNANRGGHHPRSPKYRKTRDSEEDFKVADESMFGDWKQPSMPHLRRRASLQVTRENGNQISERRLSVYEHAGLVGRQNGKLNVLERRNIELDIENKKLRTEMGDAKSRLKTKTEKFMQDIDKLKKQLAEEQKRIREQDQLIMRRERELMKAQKRSGGFSSKIVKPKISVAPLSDSNKENM